MTYNSTGVAYGSSYVIAENSDEAYKKVRKFLDENDLGFTKDRELDKVELIARQLSLHRCRLLVALIITGNNNYLQ